MDDRERIFEGEPDEEEKARLEAFLEEEEGFVPEDISDDEKMMKLIELQKEFDA